MEDVEKFRYQVNTRLRNLAHLMSIAHDRELAAHEYTISTRQIAMLAVINRLGDKATPVEIARRQARAPSTISNILIRMEKMGLIKRVKYLKKGKPVKAVITEKGFNILKDVAPKRASIQNIMSALTDEQLIQLDATLKILREASLQEIGIHSQFMMR